MLETAANARRGLIDWFKDTLVPEQTIGAGDLDLITVTDDPDEVVSIMNRHRSWKKRMIDNPLNL